MYVISRHPHSPPRQNRAHSGPSHDLSPALYLGCGPVLSEHIVNSASMSGDPKGTRSFSTPLPRVSHCVSGDLSVSTLFQGGNRYPPPAPLPGARGDRSAQPSTGPHPPTPPSRSAAGRAGRRRAHTHTHAAREPRDPQPQARRNHALRTPTEPRGHSSVPFWGLPNLALRRAPGAPPHIPDLTCDFRRTPSGTCHVPRHVSSVNSLTPFPPWSSRRVQY